MKRFQEKSQEAMRKRGEKATAVEKLRVGMKSASAKSLVNGRSKVRVASDVSLSTTPICHASKRAVEENQSSVTDERSRCWGKAAAPNEVIFLSSSISSPSSIVKFDVTQIYQKKKKNFSTDIRTKTGCSSRLLNVGKAFPCCYEVAAMN
jgi:hypothetical protein